jgi:putative DNA primase/helicase
MSEVRLADRARGRWRAILPGLGMPITFLSGKNGPCPMCGGRDRWRWINRDGSGDWWCNACGHGNGVELAKRWLKLDFAQMAKRIEALLGEAPMDKEKPRNIAWERSQMQEVWQSARLIEPGDPADRYLVGRGLMCETFWPACLRYSESCPYDERTRMPALVAKVVGPDGKPVNVHRTFLTSEGKKAARIPAKKLMRGTCPPGSAIRLGPLEATLGVAEGIETALAAHQKFGFPVWSVISSVGMERFQIPKQVMCLMVFADNDLSYTGQAAAYALAKRASLQTKIEVLVKIPPEPGMDWNDYKFHVEPKEIGFGE